MALQVERSSQPQDPLQRWRCQALLTGGSRPNAHHANPPSGTTQRPALRPSRLVLEQIVSCEPCCTTAMTLKETREQGRAACQPSFPMRLRHPQVKAVTATRGDRPSRFLQISSLLNPHTGAKRRRSRLDVDGPNTADLSFKKRRLRFQLVTSRLSQPYSHPATHTPYSRDMETATARRSTNLVPVSAAGCGPQKRNATAQATSFLRFSMMNRMRQRLGLKETGLINVDGLDAGFAGLDVASRPTVQQKTKQEPEEKQLASWTVNTTATGRGCRVTSKTLERRHPAKEVALHRSSKAPPHPIQRTAEAVPSLKLAAIDSNNPSPVHATTSSEPRPPRKTYNLFEDSFAFMHSDGEPFGDLREEPDDVYCDFGVLFSKAQSPCSGTADGLASEAVDDYGGLPWVVM